jgi:UDP-N-acetylmuramoyl-L-alanyl-D-glutamate--2,6-diaminopimelate ligase
MPIPPRESMHDALRPRSVPGCRVRDVAAAVVDAVVHGETTTVLTGVTHDSRQVRPGDLYVARPGEKTHGIRHVDAALAAGAVAVLTDPPSVETAARAGATAVVAVADVRAAAGPAAAAVYDHPADGMAVLGITGTNGKTTTSYLVEAGLRASGHVTGMVGTVETRIAGDVVASVRTTPESTDLQALFAVMRERGVDAVAMEVSSHALALDRVAGTTFDVAAFTNLSQDHLDFHRDMASYFAAKARLFEPELSRRAVVMVDDEWGRRLAVTTTVPVVTVGTADADWTVTGQRSDAEGAVVELRSPQGDAHVIDVGLAGRFNLSNAALAYVVLIEAGVEPATARAGIAGLRTVPGRMERIDSGQPFLALVDYAHTPDAVSSLLEEARVLADTHGGRVLVVIGCGGDRDRGKRPLMGAAAAHGADVAVFTNDNPRSEDPLEILDAVVTGARSAGTPAQIVVEPDRRRAVAHAVEAARAGDVVVVAGKGHEQGQEVQGSVLPFDDRDVLREALASHGFAVATR